MLQECEGGEERTEEIVQHCVDGRDAEDDAGWNGEQACGTSP